MKPVRKAILIVLDSVGIGEAADASSFGDMGSATLPHVAAAVGGLQLPNLGQLGLGSLAEIEGVPAEESPSGARAVMEPRSAGKDTTSGHWELAGLILDRPFPTYPDGFPARIISAFEEAVGRKTLGNVAASGTEIIERLGAEHVETGRPIVYTSADSVFQIAAHEDVIPVAELYEMCVSARGILRGEDEVGRVIARPFEGSPGAFKRTSGRRDFSVDPPGPTILDAISERGLATRGVGKIANIFAGRGVTEKIPTGSNELGVDATIRCLEDSTPGLVFTNLVDFDEAYGHRNDPAGYGAALEAFDRRLPEIVGAMGGDDVLFVTADHGNDPTTPSTDHSREKVPLLVVGSRVRPGVDLGVRSSFADCGATILELLGITRTVAGASFAADLVEA